MKYRKGHKIRNIEFIEFCEPYGNAKWKCPFCGKIFPFSVDLMRKSSFVYSCGCTTDEEAKAYYMEKIEAEFAKGEHIVSRALRSSGVTQGMYTAFMKDEEFKERIDELIERKKDFLETAFLQKVSEGDTSAILLAMKSKLMKDRGYFPATNGVNEQTELDFGQKIINDL